MFSYISNKNTINVLNGPHALIIPICTFIILLNAYIILELFHYVDSCLLFQKKMLA